MVMGSDSSHELRSIPRRFRRILEEILARAASWALVDEQAGFDLGASVSFWVDPARHWGDTPQAIGQHVVEDAYRPTIFSLPRGLQTSQLLPFRRRRTS